MAIATVKVNDPAVSRTLRENVAAVLTGSLPYVTLGRQVTLAVTRRQNTLHASLAGGLKVQLPLQPHAASVVMATATQEQVRVDCGDVSAELRYRDHSKAGEIVRNLLTGCYKRIVFGESVILTIERHASGDALHITVSGDIEVRLDGLPDPNLRWVRMYRDHAELKVGPFVVKLDYSGTP